MEPDFFANPTVLETAEHLLTGAGRVLLKVGAMLLLGYLLAGASTLMVWSVGSGVRRSSNTPAGESHP